MLESVVSKFELRLVLYGLCILLGYELGFAWYFNSAVLFYYSLYDFIRGAVVTVPLGLLLLALLHVAPTAELRRHADPEGEKRKWRGRVERLDGSRTGAFVRAVFSNLHTIFYFAVTGYFAFAYPAELPVAVIGFTFTAVLIAMFMHSIRLLNAADNDRWRFDVPSVGALSLSAFLVGSLVADRIYLTAFLPGNSDAFVCEKIILPQTKILRGLEHGHLVLVDKKTVRYVDDECKVAVDLPVYRQGLSRIWYGR